MNPRDPGWINRTARLAGAWYLAIVPFSAFGILYLPSVLVVRGDPAATARNLMASEWLLRSAVVAHLVAETLPVWVALTVYRLLKPGTLT